MYIALCQKRAGASGNCTCTMHNLCTLLSVSGRRIVPYCWQWFSFFSVVQSQVCYNRPWIKKCFFFIGGFSPRLPCLQLMLVVLPLVTTPHLKCSPFRPADKTEIRGPSFTFHKNAQIMHDPYDQFLRWTPRSEPSAGHLEFLLLLFSLLSPPRGSEPRICSVDLKNSSYGSVIKSGL